MGAGSDSLICPTFRTLATRNSDDQFFRANASSVKHFKPWYNYTMNAYLGSEDTDGVTKTRVRKLSEVRKPWNTFCFVEESPLVDTRYNASGLNDTFMVPGDDTMVSGWMSRVGNDPDLVIPGPEGVGQFYDVVCGYHHASAADMFHGKGNCAILDGHVEAFTRAETFPHAYPH